MGQQINLQQNSVSLEQQINASQENFAQALVVMVETFRRFASIVSIVWLKRYPKNCQSLFHDVPDFPNNQKTASKKT